MMELCSAIFHNQDDTGSGSPPLPSYMKFSILCFLNKYLSNAYEFSVQTEGEEYSYMDEYGLRSFQLDLNQIKSYSCYMDETYVDLSRSRAESVHSLFCRQPYIGTHYFATDSIVAPLLFTDNVVKRFKEGSSFVLYKGEYRKLVTVRSACTTSFLIKTHHEFLMKDGTEHEYAYVTDVEL